MHSGSRIKFKDLISCGRIFIEGAEEADGGLADQPAAAATDTAADSADPEKQSFSKTIQAELTASRDHIRKLTQGKHAPFALALGNISNFLSKQSSAHLPEADDNFVATICNEQEFMMTQLRQEREPLKLTPMIYTALHIIMHGREKGISVVDLGKKPGYDQKTCFYNIKQLVELELVVKCRRPRISTNLCMHKYLFERSLVWRQVIEEARAQAEDAGAQTSLSRAR
ncbi:hypothetical protein A0H81_13638 [Grifola frondosa]|uniref:B-block binding subunit of TFIIIC domain-containing protein n=1 Tax=Grifola frondosa TaxID=5627 RepID=A0A1C7LNT5_GRIFR|nr:hypothetical protein A0H81_13638 [Grifola frondosa]